MRKRRKTGVELRADIRSKLKSIVCNECGRRGSAHIWRCIECGDALPIDDGGYPIFGDHGLFAELCCPPSPSELN